MIHIAEILQGNRIYTHRLQLVLTTLGSLGLLLLSLLLAMEGISHRTVLAAPRIEPAAFCDTAQGISISECTALVAFYNSTDGDNWQNNTGWLQSTRPCTDWHGITCTNGIVLQLVLNSNLLSGTLPAEISSLHNLMRLELRNNQLRGELPKGIEGLNSLNVLMLSGNQLTGDISAYDWEKFPKMIDLRLDGNRFTGQIPPILGELRDLQKLYLSGNTLSGAIPDTFGAYCINGTGGMCNLTILDLGRTGISGTLPSSLGNLSLLKNFNILDNHITGTVPIELANWQNIEIIFADNNDLQGELLPFIGMTKIITLRLSSNYFTGTIPASFGSLTQLKGLWLGNNQLRGPLPTAVACLPNLAKGQFGLALAENMLTVEDEAAKRCMAALSESGDYREILGHQTVPPAILRTGEITDRYVELLWEPIYRGDLGGYYEIAYTESPSQVPIFTDRTADQRTDRFEVRNLIPATDYYFYIRTYTRSSKPLGNGLISAPTLHPMRVRMPETGARLTVRKEVSPTAAMPGEEVTYQLTIAANEGSAAFSIVDTWPLSTTLSRMPSGGAQVVDGQIIYSGTVMAEAPLVIEYKARIKQEVNPGRILVSQAVAHLQNAEKAERHIASAAVAVKGQPTIDTLVLIYTSGDNNLNDKMRDLFQKAEAASMPAGMVALLLYDGPGAKDAYYYRIQHDGNREEFCPADRNWGCSGRYKLNETMWEWTDEVGAAGSLRDFVTGAMLAYPADKVVLSLVGHGSGWSPLFLGEQPSTHEEQPTNRLYGGLLWDKQPDLALSTAELRTALTAVTAATGQKIDLLYLDACLMAMSEVLYELRDTANYVLASPGVSWTSFRYDLHLTWAQAPRNPAVIGQKWIENEAQELQSGVVYPYFYTLFNLSGGRVEELANYQDTLASTLITVLQQDASAQQRIQRAAAQSACFDTDQDHYLTQKDYNCDLGSLAHQLIDVFSADPQPAPEFADAYGAVIEAAQALQGYLETGANNLVVAKQYNTARHPHNSSHDPVWEWPNASGLSIYLPLHSPEDEWHRRFYNPTYLVSAADGYWDDLIDMYYNKVPSVLPAVCADCVPDGPEETQWMLWLPAIHKGNATE